MLPFSNLADISDSVARRAEERWVADLVLGIAKTCRHGEGKTLVAWRRVPHDACIMHHCITINFACGHGVLRMAV